MNFLRHLSVLFLLPALLWAAESPVVKNGSVQVSLVSASAALEAGKPFTIALRMQHDPHWHSYWINPGTGYPTSLDWQLPPGFTAGPLIWPTPHVVKDSHGQVTGNGYEKPPASKLPTHWPLALEAAAESVFLREALSPAFLDLFLAVKRQECEKFNARITEVDFEWYLENA